MDDLEYILESVFGEVLDIEDLAPGVCLFAISRNERGFAREYYLVDQTSTIISSKAKSYGKPIEGHPDLFVYDVDVADSGYQIIRYEIALYQYKKHSTPEAMKELRNMACYGTENHPEYFGTFPAPIDTPRGRTLRSKSIWNGVWCLETDQGEKMVAICYPIWDTEISQDAQIYGEQTQRDREHGIENTYGYLFFSWEASCIPLFELMSNYRDPPNEINFLALKNVIWEKYPEYALMNNLEEQKIKLELKQRGIDISSYHDSLIEYSPDVGSDFLMF